MRLPQHLPRRTQRIAAELFCVYELTLAIIQARQVKFGYQNVVVFGTIEPMFDVLGSLV